MNVQDLTQEVNDLVSNFVNDKMTKVDSDAKARCSLDRRAVGGSIYYDKDCLAVEGSTRSLDYYGGFEYVDKTHKKQMGDYTFYVKENEYGEECERITGVLDALHGVDEADQPDEE